MTLNKTFNPESNSFEPDYDRNWYELKSAQLNPDGETYTATLRWIGNCPETITRMQGRVMLLRLDKLDEVEALIATMDRETQELFNAGTWHRLNPIVVQLGTMYGWDLDEKFREASKIL